MSEQIITAEEINNAYEELADAKKWHRKYGRDLINATIALKVGRAELLAAGIEGSNQKQRDANLEIELSSLKAEEDRISAHSIDTRLEMDIAQIEVDRCKMLVRLMEIEAAYVV